jgi:hypothetical protein
LYRSKFLPYITHPNLAVEITVEYEAKLTDIIASLPEVTGGFLYAPDRGIYSNQTTDFTGDESLEQVSLKLTKIVSMLSVHFNDTGAIRISFKDLILFGTPLVDDHWLFLLHHPSLSPGMVKMTVQMALNIEPEEAVQTEITAIPPSDETEQEDASTSLPDIREILLAPESELSKPLGVIREQLAEYIGPVAELVFKDSIEIWASRNTPSLENFPELLSMLEAEIDDEDDRKVFRESLNSIEGV